VQFVQQRDRLVCEMGAKSVTHQNSRVGRPVGWPAGRQAKRDVRSRLPLFPPSRVAWCASSSVEIDGLLNCFDGSSSWSSWCRVRSMSCSVDEIMFLENRSDSSGGRGWRTGGGARRRTNRRERQQQNRLIVATVARNSAMSDTELLLRRDPPLILVCLFVVHCLWWLPFALACRTPREK
jgi:hypothetical protein